MQSTVSLAWRYSPPEILGDAFHHTTDDYTFTILDGAATVEVDGAIFDKDPKFQANASEILTGILDGPALSQRIAIQISAPSMTRKQADGSQILYVDLDMGSIGVSVSEHLTILRNGVPIYDSESERLTKESSAASKVTSESRILGARISKHHNDPLLTQLVMSYKASIANPENEFLRLYEIRDALGKRFGGEAKVCAALNVSGRGWGRFGTICNDGTISQGRHCGTSGSSAAIRSATSEEFQQVRNFALEMLRGYLTYLDSQIKP